MNLWEVQGSYKQPFVAGRVSHRVNQTKFIITDTLERAAILWYSGLPDGCGSPSVHQVIRRNNNSTMLVIDPEYEFVS